MNLASLETQQCLTVAGHVIVIHNLFFSIDEKLVIEIWYLFQVVDS